MLSVVAPLAKWIEERSRASSGTMIIGLNGAQGSGKSTLALFLQSWLQEEAGLRVARLSLDDLYLTADERNELAASVHALLRTRGVPGTHDVGLGLKTLSDLTSSDSAGSVVALPVFDKSIDDRAPEQHWQSVASPVDIVLFEGWCIGASPQEDGELARSVNDLEADEDPDCKWRRFVNGELASSYTELWAHLNALIMLRIPAFETVAEWRGLQESKLRERAGDSSAGQDKEELARFIQHFERLTRHMLETMPEYADIIVDIDNNHRMSLELSVPHQVGRMIR